MWLVVDGEVGVLPLLRSVCGGRGWSVGEATVIRLIDLLAVAVDDMRQGGDPRLPLELALVKVTRPGADLSRESIAYRLEQLETRGPVAAPQAASTPVVAEASAPAAAGDAERRPLRAAGYRARAAAGGVGAHDRARPSRRSRSRSRPCSARRGPSELDGDTLTVEFPASASFHRQLAEEPKNATLLRDALYEVTGREARARVRRRRRRDGDEDVEAEGPAGEERILELMKETFDAREREEQQ